MSQPFRFSRSEPQRRGPQRSFSYTYDYPGPADAATRAPHAPTGGGRVDSVIASAVDLGYRVIEEQLQQGQAIARQLRHGSRDPHHEKDVSALVDSLSRVAKEALGAWIEVLQAVRGVEAPRGGEIDRAAGFAIEVKSSRPTHVTLDICSVSDRFVPYVSELKSLTHGKQALTKVRFTMNPSGERGVLLITVPDDLAPGVYSGEILDSVTKQFGGTIRVRIDP